MAQRKSDRLSEHVSHCGDMPTISNTNDALSAGQPHSFEFRSATGALLANVRAVLVDGLPWFYAVDVCDALGLTNPTVALQGVDAEDKAEHNYYLGSGRNPLLANESGLYTLIFKSRKPAAREFKRWITPEVLPSIRSTGSYSGVLPALGVYFSGQVAAARAWADAYEAKQQVTGYAQRQAKYITHLESLFSEELTPVQFCRQLNGVNPRNHMELNQLEHLSYLEQVNTTLIEIGQDYHQRKNELLKLSQRWLAKRLEVAYVYRTGDLPAVAGCNEAGRFRYQQPD